MKKGGHVPLDETKLSNVLEGKKEHYPSILNLDEGDLKEIKDWIVGKEYEVKLKVKMVNASANGEMSTYNDSDKDKVHARFEVLKAECEEEEED